MSFWVEADLGPLRCLTIESEERETWAAGCPCGRLGSSGPGCREETIDGHVILSIAFWRREMSERVLGTRRENTVTSRVRNLIQLESLILAQNERWQQA